MQRLIKQYEAGASTTALAKRVGIDPTALQRRLKKAGVTLRPAGFRRGEDHHAWAGGRREGNDGYFRVWVPADHRFASMAQRHGKSAGGYVLEHRFIMAEQLGRPLEAHETVHHKDGDRQNNHPDNLELRQGAHGKGSALRCADCGSHNIVAASLAVH